MKYPLAVVPAAVGWNVVDADGAFVSLANTKSDANTIRDAMNKCAPPPLEDRPVAAFDCWGYALGIASKPYNAEADRDAAFRNAEMLGTRPVRGRFIPDNLTAADVYAEVARLLNMLEPTVNAPSVKRTAYVVPLDAEMDYESDGAGMRIHWDGPTIDGIIDVIRSDVDGRREDEDSQTDWGRLESDYHADADADARMRNAKEGP